MATSFAFFGIDPDGIGIVLNLLIFALIAIDIALVFWTGSDARGRIEDPFLRRCAWFSALLFPFAGVVVYAIVRPSETLDDRYERELDIRAAELRVELLESSIDSGTKPAMSAAVAREVGLDPLPTPRTDRARAEMENQKPPPQPRPPAPVPQPIPSLPQRPAPPEREPEAQSPSSPPPRRVDTGPATAAGSPPPGSN